MCTTVNNKTYVYSGAGSHQSSLSDVQVNGGGTLDVGYKGTVSNVTALGAAAGYYYGAQPSIAVISAHGDGANAIVKNYTISNYAQAYATNGGEFLNGSINGGTVQIGSGAEIGDTNIYGSGNYTNTATANRTQDYVNVLSGGTASGITTYGGSLNIGNGGFVESSHASSGYINVSAGASGTGNTVFAGGQLNALGGTLTDSIVSGGQLNVKSGGTADSVTVLGGVVSVTTSGVLKTTLISGGTVDLDSTGQIAQGATVTVENGGQLILNGGADNGTIVLAGSNSLLTVSGDTMPTGVISGLENGGKIDLVDLKTYKSVVATDSGIDFTGVNTKGQTVDFHLNVPNAKTIGWKLVSDNAGGLYYEIGNSTNNNSSAPVTSGLTVKNGSVDYVFDNGSGSQPDATRSYYGQSVENAQVNGGGTLNVGYNGTVDKVAAVGNAGTYGTPSIAVISAHGDGKNAIVKEYTISNYAQAYATNGGEFLNGSVNGGTVQIGSGAEIGNTNIYGSGNYTNTATANRTQDYVNVLSGGTASGITTYGGSLNIGNGGFVESSHASSGYINVSAGASGTGNTVFEGGQLNALGGTLTDSTLSGGELWISSGGTASGVQDGSSGSAVGRIYVSNGTLDKATVSGGTVFVGQKGVFENSVLLGSGTLNNTDTANRTQDYANITSGGYASGITTQGGSLNVAADASADHSIASAGYINIQSGASGTGNTVAGSQAQLNALGGTLTSSTVLAGQLNVESGGKANIVSVSGGVLKDNGATVTSATIVGSGSANIISGGVLSASTVASGGIVNVDSASTLSGVTTISNGGQLILNGSAGDGPIVMAADTSLLTISGNTMPTNVISGLKNGGKIDLANLKNVTQTKTTATGIDFIGTDENGKNVDFHLNIPDADSIGHELFSDGHGGLYYEVCFLSGSMIRTPDGDVAVEDLETGDLVVSFDWKNNKNITRPVVWVGKAHANVRTDLPDDEAGWPVRILKNAISEGVPYKDMLITAEHCLFFDGRFVPARMLVNGKSIFYDKSIATYDYYHVETAQHSVITADGMLTESYLDTGNRASFRQTGSVVSLRNVQSGRSWEQDAAAPLCVERSFVEPLFHMLKERLGTVPAMTAGDEAAELTHNPAFHLVTDNGAVIQPLRYDGQRYAFLLPANTAAVSLVSRASRPADLLGPFVDDRRMMGLAVADVHLVTAGQHVAITAHLGTEKPEGWHTAEQADHAWTNGHAVLPLGTVTQDSVSILSLHVRAAGPYLLHSEKQHDLKKQSA